MPGRPAFHSRRRLTAQEACRQHRNMPKGERLGKAHALHGSMWQKWLQHVRDSAHPKYFLILWLTQALCIRVSQALLLTTDCFDLQGKRVYLQCFKRHSAVWKPLLPTVLKFLLQCKRKGIQNKQGAKWTWPANKKSWLFPSRRGSKRPHVSKDVLCHVVGTVRKSFLKRHHCLQGDKSIRTHSGRRHAISSIAAAGVPADVGMCWAQISSAKVYRQYVDCQPAHVEAQMQKFDRTHRVGKARG